MDEFDSLINSLNQTAFELHFIDGSATLHEIFGPNSVIKSVEMQELKEDTRYMPAGTKLDYYALADEQPYEGLRVKGYVFTHYGAKQRFDVLITFSTDINKILEEEIRDRTYAIKKLADYAKKKMGN